MPWCIGMNVIKLKALDEGAVQDCRAHRVESLVPADDSAIARSFHLKDSLRCCAAPWQLCAYQSTCDAIEDEMLCICSYLAWHVVQLDGGHEIADSTCRSTWGTGWCLIPGVKHGEEFGQH